MNLKTNCVFYGALRPQSFEEKPVDYDDRNVEMDGANGHHIHVLESEQRSGREDVNTYDGSPSRQEADPLLG